MKAIFLVISLCLLAACSGNSWDDIDNPLHLKPDEVGILDD